MNYQLSAQTPFPGFNFTNCVRNRELINNGLSTPRCFSAGTIAGLRFRDGIVLGADSRGTSDATITDKRNFKIHRITTNIFCCAAGTAADVLKICELTAAQMKLLYFQTKTCIPVIAVATVMKQLLYHFKEMDISFVIAGYNNSEFHLHSVHRMGYSDYLPYVTIGSGCEAAMSVVEPRWYPNMTKLKATRLVRDAIKIGICNDLASGGYVDMCIIKKNGFEYVRHILAANPSRCILMGSAALYKRRRKTAKRNLQYYEIRETVIMLETKSNNNELQ